MNLIEHCQINMRITRALSRALDLADAHDRQANEHSRATRASVLRAALIAHLAAHPSARVRATVAPRGH